jgi:hypothetical protein
MLEANMHDGTDMNPLVFWLIILFASVTSALFVGIFVGLKGLPPLRQYREYRRRTDRFKIRVAPAASRFDLRSLDSSSATTIAADFVTDASASFVADPFLFSNGGVLWLLFEALDQDAGRGVICAASSEDALEWKYFGKVLEENFHLSYPHLISHGGEIYMIPETHETHSVRLYRAEEFPSKWTHEATLLTGHLFCDSTVFFKDGMWWMFTTVEPHLHLYFSKSLTGPWQQHPSNPIIASSRQHARMGGSVFEHDGRWIRVSQDGARRYGHFLRGYEILELSETTYRETELSESPILTPRRKSWKPRGCHHLDGVEFGGKWVIASDGY